MGGQEGIAQRVADSITADTLTSAQVAAQIGLTDEELSESLCDRRAFSSVELVKLAEVLNVDAHWLITGRPDPHNLTVTARLAGMVDQSWMRMVSMTLTVMVRPRGEPAPRPPYCQWTRKLRMRGVDI